MTRHDMSGFYRFVGARLDEAGHRHVSYCLDIEWWCHRHADDESRPQVAIYVAWGPGVGTHYTGADFATAFAQLDADLVNHPATAPPVPAAVPDVEVLAC